jgi:hypothetical protein
MDASDESSIREDDKELATRLSTEDDVNLKGAELLQLAAIYAALPEERRRLWFARLSSEGVSPALLAQIVARAGRMIRFPDSLSSERLLQEDQSERHQKVVRAADRRRRSSDFSIP